MGKENKTSDQLLGILVAAILFGIVGHLIGLIFFNDEVAATVIAAILGAAFGVCIEVPTEAPREQSARIEKLTAAARDAEITAAVLEYDAQWHGDPDRSWSEFDFIDPWSEQDVVEFHPAYMFPRDEIRKMEKGLVKDIRTPDWKVRRELENARQDVADMKITIHQIDASEPIGKAHKQMQRRRHAHLANFLDYSEWLIEFRKKSSPSQSGGRGNLPNHGIGGAVSRKSRKPDSAYLWQVEGTDMFKLGITSAHRGEQRIKEVARGANVNAIIWELMPVVNAQLLERKLLSFGKPADVGKVGGNTEFRVLSVTQARKVAKLIQDAAVLEENS